MRFPGKVPLIACIVAFVIAGGAMVVAALGQIVMLPLALILLIGGIGILRKRVWSAYGLALIYFAQMVPASLILARRPAPEISAEVIGTAVFAVILGCLFSFAGRSLAKTGA